MVFDIERVSSYITENVFIKSAQFAKQITEIFDEDINLIMQARKTFLSSEDIPEKRKVIRILMPDARLF